MQETVLLEKTSSIENDTKWFAAQTVHYLQPGDTILLYGNLGSGKTMITREYVRLLGNHSSVTSPSFTIINRYEGEPSVNHIDLYRITGTRELTNLGLEDIWVSDSINFIEWPQKIEDQISWQHYRLFIEHVIDKEPSRSLKFVRYG